MKHFGPHLSDLSKFARALVRNTDMAKDLVQETTLAVLSAFGTIRDKSAIKSFIFTSAYRIHKRNQLKRKLLFFMPDDQMPEIRDYSKSTDKNLELEYLYSLLDKLGEKQKEAIILFEISGFSISEIAKIQGGTESGVKSRLKRAREELQNMVKSEAKIYSLHTEIKQEGILVSNFNS